MHRQQLFISSGLYDAFSCIVDCDCTLLRLLVGVSTDVDERFDDIVECVVVIVMDYQIATAVVKQFDILFFLLFVFMVLFHCFLG